MTSSTLPQMYDITVTNGVAKNVSYIDITKAKPGDKVVLLADDRRDEGFAFEKWVVTGATVDAENNMTAKFIMPEGNVTAEATYIPCDILCGFRADESAIVVGVTGFEPAASTSQTSRATNCATPRSVKNIRFLGHFP